jgi:hypothetical protein
MAREAHAERARRKEKVPPLRQAPRAPFLAALYGPQAVFSAK